MEHSQKHKMIVVVSTVVPHPLWVLTLFKNKILFFNESSIIYSSCLPSTSIHRALFVTSFASMWGRKEAIGVRHLTILFFGQVVVLTVMPHPLWVLTLLKKGDSDSQWAIRHYSSCFPFMQLPLHQHVKHSTWGQKF